jgi:hypothetical protein
MLSHRCRPYKLIKVAALLLHPRRHPWKVLMRAAFIRQVPGLGYAECVIQPAGAALRFRKAG